MTQKRDASDLSFVLMRRKEPSRGLLVLEQHRVCEHEAETAAVVIQQLWLGPEVRVQMQRLATELVLAGHALAPAAVGCSPHLWNGSIIIHGPKISLKYRALSS